MKWGFYRFEDHSSCHSSSCFKKIVNVDFYFLFSQMIVFTFTRTEETKIRTKLCFMLLMDQSTKFILLWYFQRDQWDASLSMLTVIQSQQFSILIPTYQLEMYHMISIPHFTQVNLHKKTTPKTITNWTWCDKKDKATSRRKSRWYESTKIWT